VKRFTANFLILVLSSGLALALAEFSVRELMPMYAPGSAAKLHYYPQHELILGLKNSIGRQWDKMGEFNVEVRFNDLGLRDDKDVRTSQRRDIVLLGDSFMVGHGIEASMRCGDIAEVLAAKRIFNAAIGRSDLDDYRRIHEYLLERGAKASRIILGVFLGNDLRDYAKPKPPPNLTVTQRLKSWLEGRSALYRSAATVIKQVPATASVARYFDLLESASTSDRPMPDEVIVSSADQVSLLTEGFDALVLLVPTKEYWIPESGGTQRATHHAFLGALRERGLTVLDWAEGISDSEHALSLYFNADGHWNNAGHRRCGELLGTWIAQNWPDGATQQR